MKKFFIENYPIKWKGNKEILKTDITKLIIIDNCVENAVQYVLKYISQDGSEKEFFLTSLKLKKLNTLNLKLK